MLNKKQMLEFVKTAKNGDLAYNSVAKARWHRLAKQVAHELATILDLSTYDVRYNPGGVAVWGDTTLHAEGIYINLSVSCSRTLGFMYRSCTSRHDYTGGRNQWMQFDELLDMDKAGEKMAEVLRPMFEVMA